MSCEWMEKFFGGCNVQKDQLNHCLRIECIARTTENRTASKECNLRTYQALREFRAASQWSTIHFVLLLVKS
ncbi:hypothetical protein BYT27DRAFT_6925129 [Phlegmacium glaucopus]|nr:hypothetical protein BYT27DRAFT_6925129 [Phlegmacium glaucopus]